jgi:hypothetical protein
MSDLLDKIRSRANAIQTSSKDTDAKELAALIVLLANLCGQVEDTANEAKKAVKNARSS